jgi:DMSO/TMAO reductase YedYZ heme-binding membrane subunit
MLKNIRFYILLISLAISFGIYIWVLQNFNSQRTQTIRLTQLYALVALAYLYITVIIGPLMYQFYSFRFKNQLLKARRAIGVSGFYFATLHASLAFFGQLGGFRGLGFLSNTYLIAIVISFIAYLILLAMALTAFDWVIARMKFKKWKLLHRFIYAAILLIVIHSLMLGTHFMNLSSVIPQIFALALGLLLILEAPRVDIFLKKYLLWYPTFPLVLVLFSLVTGVIICYTWIPASIGNTTLGIHAQHIQIAKEAQNSTNLNPQGGNINQAMTGDRSKRYTVSYDHPETIIPGTPAKLSFRVNDASSGNQVVLFNTVYEKKIHLIIVDSTLQFFDHVHPEASSNGFSIDYTFPQAGEYHLYIDFQPVGAIEQQFAFVQSVGDVKTVSVSNDQPSELTKDFGQYNVSLNFPTPLQSNKISIGGQKFAFTFKDTASGQPVTNLKPYLASFGHLVMINTKTYDYIHVHPTNLVAPKPTDTSGPTVEFLPLGLYGPIKPGIYKVFGQFNPDGKLLVTNFVVEIK